MNYSIIGSGNVGTALARQFARSGITVGIANTRGPSSIKALASELGGRIVAQSMQEALGAEVVVLAVPFRAHRAVAAGLPNWSGKIVVDAMNTYGVPPEELEGALSSDVVARAFAERRSSRHSINCRPSCWRPIQSKATGAASCLWLATTQTRTSGWANLSSRSVSRRLISVGSTKAVPCWHWEDRWSCRTC
jgi:hypothetical protein